MLNKVCVCHSTRGTKEAKLESFSLLGPTGLKRVGEENKLASLSLYIDI